MIQRSEVGSHLRSLIPRQAAAGEATMRKYVLAYALPNLKADSILALGLLSLNDQYSHAAEYNPIGPFLGLTSSPQCPVALLTD